MVNDYSEVTTSIPKDNLISEAAYTAFRQDNDRKIAIEYSTDYIAHIDIPYQNYELR